MKFLMALCFLFTGSAAFACHDGTCKHDHGGKDMPAMSKEDRAKMATAHEAMAACLKSERTDKDCRDEMHKSFEGMHPHKMGKMGKKHDHKKKDEAKP